MKMKISKLKLHENNPRLIKDGKFKKLVKSIKDFPKMLELRPLIVDEDFVIQGGNMRYKALLELGYTEIPDEWVKQVIDLTEEQKKEFMVKDNVNFGEWDFEELANTWDMTTLKEWDVISWDVADYTPVLEPTSNNKDVTDSDIQKKIDEFNNKFTNQSDWQKSHQFVEVICPNCAHEFKLTI